MVYKFGVTTSKNEIISIKDKDYEMVTNFLGIDGRVKMTSSKHSIYKKSIHFSIPSPRVLLKAIKKFLEATYKARVILDVARRLLHVDFFLQIPMQEGCWM